MLIVSRNNSVRYGATFLIALGVSCTVLLLPGMTDADLQIYPAVPCLLSWLVNNTSGHTKRACASGSHRGRRGLNMRAGHAARCS
jgi:hypothetical protein